MNAKQLKEIFDYCSNRELNIFRFRFPELPEFNNLSFEVSLRIADDNQALQELKSLRSIIYLY